MAKKQEGQWGELFGEARKALKDYFKWPEDENKRQAARVATSVLSSYTRHEATDSAKVSTAVIIARALAEDKEEFKEYLRISVPEIQLPSEKLLAPGVK